jgi:hypothetical protein
MKTKPNEPLNCNNGNGFWNDEMNRTHAGIGLTKREYFAAMIFQGILSGVSGVEAHSGAHPASWSETAVDAADALIEALNKIKGLE